MAKRAMFIHFQIADSEIARIRIAGRKFENGNCTCHDLEVSILEFSTCNADSCNLAICDLKIELFSQKKRLTDSSMNR